MCYYPYSNVLIKEETLLSERFDRHTYVKRYDLIQLFYSLDLYTQ